MSIPPKGAQPIESRNDLVAYLEAGCKPPLEWRIGTEHEKFGFHLETRRPLPYDGKISISAMLEGLASRYDWERIYEDGKVIGLSRDKATISLEPGGQLELSGVPLRTLHQTCDEVNMHLREVGDIAGEIGAGFFGLGVAPVWKRDEMPHMPKGRYGLMRRYMQQVGIMGLDMMYRTTTIQVNLDYESEFDMVRKFRAGLLLQPVATALFANSPFADGRPTGYLSWRARIWEDVDPQRSGFLPFVFEEGFGFEAWTDYALDVPMYFVYRDGRYIDATGQSFRDFLDGRLAALTGERPLMSDWADHLTTVFTDVRLKQFLEMRGADGGPWRRICALPAFWVGLLYDSDSLSAVEELTRDWTMVQHASLRKEVPYVGMRATIAGRRLLDIAADLLDIAYAGLKNRAHAFGFDIDEGHFLDDLRATVETGETLAEEMIRRHRSEWHGSFKPLYDGYAY